MASKTTPEHANGVSKCSTARRDGAIAAVESGTLRNQGAISRRYTIDLMSDAAAHTDLLPSSGGNPSLDGYDYQLDVSVWTALELLLARRIARQFVLEPATQEDLEADLENAPSALTEEAKLEDYRLVIQCKLTRGGPWKHGALSALLEHGTRRASAQARLVDPNIRYLLVSNADLDGVARKLQVEDLGEWPAAADMPPEMAARLLPTQAAGRIAVLGALDTEKLDARTERLLTGRFHVPWPRITDCRNALRQQARDRMRGGAGGVWTREQIEASVRDFGGYAGDSEVLEGFVPPTNWNELRAALHTRHAIIIAGPSGTGKTRAARALLAEVEKELPGVELVHVNGGPEKIHHHHPPVAFEIEDPWGQYRLEPTALPWNDRINEVLSSARSDRKFVITSRSDVMRESGPKSLAAKWFVYLEAEHYGVRERMRLFESRRHDLPLEVQQAAIEYQKEAIEGLETPFEMQRYFNVLAEDRLPGEGNREFVWRCLAEARQGSIEKSILSSLRKRDDWRWAVLVWGLFEAFERVSFNILPFVQAGLTRCERAFEDGLMPFVNFLIAGHHLRQTESVLSYHHPRVQAGLEQALIEKPELASRVLHYLVEILVARDEPGADWGHEGAARIVAAAHALPQLNLALPPPIQAQLDQWVRERLTSAGAAFEDDLNLAAVVGSDASPPAQLARWLTRTEKGKGGFFLEIWSPHPATPEWYAAIGADPATRVICEAFIRRLLTSHSGWFPDDFAHHIGQLSSHLTPAFRDAALSIVGHGYHSHTDPILTGALADLDEFEPVVTAAIEHETYLREVGDEGVWLALANGEYGDEDASSVQEDRGQEGYTADEILKDYVRALRSRGGWPAVSHHPQVSGLIVAWLDVAFRDEDSSDEEWIALAQASYGRWPEYWLWDRAEIRWRAVLASFVLTRLVEGTEDSANRTHVANLLAHHLQSDVPALVSALAARDRDRRVLELATDLTAVRETVDEAEAVLATLDSLVGALPHPLNEAAGMLAGIKDPNTASAASIALLENLVSGGNSRLKLAQARALSARGINVVTLLGELLSFAGENSDGEMTVMTAAIELTITLGHWPLVRNALSHRFANVREHALVALAEPVSGPLPAELLTLAEDKGNRVRKALATLLRTRRYPEHVPALVQLAADTWSNYRQYYGEDADCPIAQQAADVLLEFSPIDDPHAAALVEVARQSPDTQVARTLLAALVRNGSNEVRQNVMSLALSTGAPPMHRFAAEALVRELDHVSADLAHQITDAVLLRRAPGVSAPLTIVLGACASTERIRAAAQALAGEPARQALLIPLWFATREAHPLLANEIAQGLPASLLPAIIAAGDDGPKLPRTAISTLGDLRVTQQVISTLAVLFEPKQSKN